ncbi:MAG: hypothetical protein ACRDKS_14550, partial [Actinomycetota bacterium]
MRRALVATTVTATLLLAGCSDGNPPEPGARGTTPAGTTSQGKGTTGTPGATSPGPAATSPNPGGGSGSPQPTGTFPTAAPLDASIDKTCVQRGVGSDLQGLTVHVQAGDTVVYLTFYSDGRSASNDPSLGGGGGGAADGSGTFRRTWVVPATAPLGKARVVASSGNAGAQFPFTVIDPGQACP